MKSTCSSCATGKAIRSVLSDTLDTVNYQTIKNAAGHRLDRETVLCTDGAPVYQRYAQDRAWFTNWSIWHKAFAFADLYFMSKTSMFITAVGRFGWSGFMAWLRVTSITTLGGIECSMPPARSYCRTGFWQPPLAALIYIQR